jgi:hypothetical protein
VTVCGVTLTNTNVGAACSAQEALCVAPRGEQVLQLARQLTAARLNCEVETCPNAILTLLDSCDQECIDNNDSQAIGECIEQIDAFNNGVSPDALGCHDRPITGFTPPGPAGSSNDCTTAIGNDVTIFTNSGSCP